MKHNILIIEDDPSIAALQQDYLEINDMDSTISNDGQSGLELALEHDYDLIIVDIMLPKKDGFEVCKAIRVHKRTPIIIVSAKKEDIDKVRGLGLGADDYMVKPFSPTELVARVKAHIKRYEQLSNNSQKILTISDLIIDLNSHKVSINAQEIIFTNMEFQLLSFLAQHSNRVWSKDTLFEKVWGMGVIDTDVNTVVVHIKRIREKLKINGLSFDPIETLWGSGYRFNIQND